MSRTRSSLHTLSLALLTILPLSACSLEAGESPEDSPELASTESALTFGSVGSAMQIVSSGMCLTASPSGNLVWVTQQTCASAPASWFIATPVESEPSYYEIKSSGRCLDVPSSSTSSGTQLQLYPCTGNNNQRFRMNRISGFADRWEIRPKLASGLCLDIAYGDAVAGRPLQQYTCNAGNNQRFRTRPLLQAPFERTCDTNFRLHATWNSIFDAPSIDIGGGEVWYHASRSLSVECFQQSISPLLLPWQELLTCPNATGLIEISRIAPSRVRVRCYQ